MLTAFITVTVVSRLKTLFYIFFYEICIVTEASEDDEFLLVRFSEWGIASGVGKQIVTPESRSEMPSAGKDPGRAADCSQQSI